MFYKFREILSVGEENIYEFRGAVCVNTISRKCSDSISKLYKEYTGEYFPTFYAINSFGRISTKSDLKSVRETVIDNLDKLLFYKKDKRITSLDSEIRVLRNIVLHSYLLERVDSR